VIDDLYCVGLFIYGILRCATKKLLHCLLVGEEVREGVDKREERGDDRGSSC